MGPSRASLTQQPQILRAPAAMGTEEVCRKGHCRSTPSAQPGVLGERVQTLPNMPALPTCSTANCRARVQPARSRARVRAGGGYTGRAPGTPAASAGAAQSRSATPLPSVTRRLPRDGRAPGADPVHVGRRARSRPAPSCASLAAHGRRRRAPEAGGDRLQPV